MPSRSCCCCCTQGIQFIAGTNVFFNLLKAKGAAGGWAIKILAMDDGYEPTRCAENTAKLSEQDVFALFGCSRTLTSIPGLRH